MLMDIQGEQNYQRWLFAMVFPYFSIRKSDAVYFFIIIIWLVNNHNFNKVLYAVLPF